MTSNRPPLVVRLMSEQRKRCLATILNTAETSPWWPKLTDGEQNTFRDAVRTALNVFHDLARDVVKVSDEDGVRNDLALDLIRSIHNQQLKITEAIGPKVT